MFFTHSGTINRMELIQSKSVLARLMAAENINVQHSNVPTAFFDLKNRSLTLPLWKDMDGHMYDLLCGHEVGHALDTPEAGWHHNVSSNPKIKSFLNVIEDARIEKRIKRKFPGLARSFAAAYADLYQRDFFGIKKIADLNQLNLIDRINLHFKLGTHVIVPFTDEEREFVRETANAEKWDEVVDIANRVYNYVKSNESDKVNNASDLQDLLDQLQESLNEEGDGEESDDEESSDDSDNSESLPGAGDSGEDSDEESNEESSDNASGSDDEESDEMQESIASSEGEGSDSEDVEDDREPQSVTDNIFREREAELLSDGTGRTIMVEMPKPVMENCVVLPDAALKKFEAEAAKFDYAVMTQKAVTNFNTKNKKYISLLVKEFEMRKNATEYARAQVSRSGQLDTNKLSQYRTKNDLFRRVTTIGKGKSHAMQIVFDMSGSMSPIFRQTVDQILVLATFCKRVNIPFEIYGFSDAPQLRNMTPRTQGNNWSRDGYDKNGVPALWLDRDFRLVKYLSSDMTSLTYRRAFNMLAVVADQYNRYFDSSWSATNAFNWDAAGFRLNGTPLTETHIAMRFIAADFKKKTGVDHVNLIIMTDGEGSRVACHNAAINHAKDTVYIIDPISKMRQKVEKYDSYDYREPIVKLAHDALALDGIKVIGYYIAQRPQHLAAPGIGHDDLIAARKEVKKNGFYVTSKIVGFDQYYLMTIGDDRPDEMVGVTATSTKTQLKNAFKEMNLNKRANRGLASNFAQSIAM